MKLGINLGLPAQSGNGFPEPQRSPTHRVSPPETPLLASRARRAGPAARVLVPATASPPVLQVLVHRRRAARRQRQPLHGLRGNPPARAALRAPSQFCDRAHGRGATTAGPRPAPEPRPLQPASRLVRRKILWMDTPP
jgi:hypothetical protein